MEVKIVLNEKILKFENTHDLYIVGQCGRDRKCREVECYTIATDPNIALGIIKPDCSYEQFLEKIAIKAISEAERLYDLTDAMEAAYNELYENYEVLKEEATTEELEREEEGWN